MGNLEYIDNVNYSRGEEPTIESLAEELAEIAGCDACASEVYEALRQAILRDIRLSELAIVTIMPDLLDLLDRSPRKATLLMRLLADPYASYTNLGMSMGYSKQRVAVILHELARHYRWLATLLDLHNETKTTTTEEQK